MAEDEIDRQPTRSRRIHPAAAGAVAILVAAIAGLSIGSGAIAGRGRSRGGRRRGRDRRSRVDAGRGSPRDGREGFPRGPQVRNPAGKEIRQKGRPGRRQGPGRARDHRSRRVRGRLRPGRAVGDLGSTADPEGPRAGPGTLDRSHCRDSPGSPCQIPPERPDPSGVIESPKSRTDARTDTTGRAPTGLSVLRILL